MARKVVAEQNKKAAVSRIVAGRSTSNDEGRRYGVSPQAVRAWVREFRSEVEGANVGSDKTRREGVHGPLQAPAGDGGSQNPPPPPPASGGTGDERSDAERLKAAQSAAGVAPASPAAPGGVGSGTPGVPASGAGSPGGGALGGAPDIGDEAICEMAGNFIMGFATRGSLFLASRKAKLKVKLTPELEGLCVLTDKEKAALKPAVPFLAPRIRRFIGSNENVAVAAAISVVGMGLLDRTNAVGAAVRAAVEAAPKPAGKAA